MRPLILATGLLALLGVSEAPIEAWMQQAFYPALLLILIAASLGLPIPEDVPLIAAGVLLHTHQGIASWHGTLFIAMLGIMCGDLVLYYIGKRWGPEVVDHRSVRWLITPRRFRRAARRFRRYGMWFCFFGRFLMGIRAAMCITAGATRFPYWRFFLADFCGALITVPLWILLGYWFAYKLPVLESYLSGIRGVLAVAVVLAIVAIVVIYKIRHYRRIRAEAAEAEATPEAPPVAEIPPARKKKALTGAPLRKRPVHAEL